MAQHINSFFQDRLEEQIVGPQFLFSRVAPRSAVTSPHILVTITTFFSVLSPQSFLNMLEFLLEIPPMRKSEMRCM